MAWHHFVHVIFTSGQMAKSSESKWNAAGTRESKGSCYGYSYCTMFMYAHELRF